MNFIEIAVKRPVLTTMIILFMVVIGLYSSTKINIDMLPKVDIPVITITTVYPGSGPEEIETQISKVIEDAVISINGIDTLKSDSNEGFSNVIIQFEDNIDVDTVAADVREKVSAVKLPDDAKDPVILKLDINALPVLNISVSGKRSSEELYQFSKDYIKDELSRISGVASVDFFGGREREIQIHISSDKLEAYSLSILSLSGLIAQKSLNVPSGHIIQGNREFTIRMEGEFDNIEELRNIEIPVAGGKTLPLGEFAEVKDTFEEVREKVRVNGKECILMVVQKRSDANTINTVDKIKEKLKDIKARIPDDIILETVRDRSIFTQDSVNDLYSSLLMGIVITAITLYLFLHSVRGTIIASISIPVSIIATYSLLFAFNFTLNMMTLMALAISVGILVNNAIIVIENIFVHLSKGKTPMQASIDGTKEIIVAVSGATLTNVVVFVPIAFMTGIIGQFFYEFGMTVTFATFVSLIVAFLMTPMLSAFFIRPDDINNENKIFWKRWWDKIFKGFEKDYESILIFCMKHKIVLIFFCVVLTVSSFLLAPYIGFEFATEPDQKEFDITLKTASGSSLDYTTGLLVKIENILREKNVFSVIYTKVGKTENLIGGGGKGTHLGEISVKVKQDVKIHTDRIIEDLYKDLAVISDVELNIKKSGLMGTSESPVQIDIIGDDLKVLEEFSNKVFSVVKNTPGVVDAQISIEDGKPEYKIIPNRKKLSDFNISEAYFAMSLRSFYEGNISTKYREGDEEYDIRLQLPENLRKNTDDIEKLRFITPSGKTVLLGEIATIQRGFGPVQIKRKSRSKMVNISTNLLGRSLGEVMTDIENSVEKLGVPLGYEVVYAGTAEMMKESFTSLFVSLILAIVFTYMLLASLLESFIHPFTILISFPIAFSGIFAGLFLTGMTLSIFSLMAVVMLLGIVVNNGILLIESIRIHIEEGTNLYQSIIEGCPPKLRPILMTSITAVLAMVPLALGFGAGGEMRAPMAVITIGGLIVSTALSIFLIPVLYYIVEHYLKKADKVNLTS